MHEHNTGKTSSYMCVCEVTKTKIMRMRFLSYHRKGKIKERKQSETTGIIQRKCTVWSMIQKQGRQKGESFTVVKETYRKKNWYALYTAYFVSRSVIGDWWKAATIE